MIYTYSLQRDYDIHTLLAKIMIYTHSLMFIIMRLQTVRYVQTCGEWSTGHGVQGYDTVGYDVKGHKCSLCTDLGMMVASEIQW